MDAKPVLIAIGGCSGSGKTTLAMSLARELDAGIIPLDSYYRDCTGLTRPERDKLNYDAPEAIEHKLLTGHLRRLLRGELVHRPVYDFITHTRRAETIRVEPRRHLLVEGILALHWPEMRALYSLAVFVDLDDSECFRRRLDRDTRLRSRSEESVRRQYAQFVRPMAMRFVIPTRERADLVVSGADPVENSVAAVVERMRRLRPPAGVRS
jgi:uridine kinase